MFRNLPHKSPEKKLSDQFLFARERYALPKDPMTLKLSSLKPGNDKLVRHGAGDKRNGACTQYLERGAPDQLTRRQRNELANLAVDAPLPQEAVMVQHLLPARE